MFGVGIFNNTTSFRNYSLNFNTNTQKLMEILEKSPYYSSVRDLKSLFYLKNAGFNNFKFTGCPAFYNLETINNKQEIYNINKVKNIIFSCGSPFHQKQKAYEQQIKLIQSLNKYFKDKNLYIAFHHTSDRKIFKNIYGYINKPYFEFVDFIKKSNLKYVDISGEFQKMHELYSICDLHIGYRVHAHILMSSYKKNSILISEDGRGIGISEILNGVNFNSYNIEFKKRLFANYKQKSPHKLIKTYNNNLDTEIIQYLDYAKQNKITLNIIQEQYFTEMKNWFYQFK